MGVLFGGCIDLFLEAPWRFSVGSVGRFCFTHDATIVNQQLLIFKRDRVDNILNRTQINVSFKTLNHMRANLKKSRKKKPTLLASTLEINGHVSCVTHVCWGRHWWRRHSPLKNLRRGQNVDHFLIFSLLGESLFSLKLLLLILFDNSVIRFLPLHSVETHSSCYLCLPAELLHCSHNPWWNQSV